MMIRRSVLLTALWLLGGVAPVWAQTAPTIVQSKICGPGDFLASCAFNSNVTSGNLLLFFWGNRNTAMPHTTPTDSISSTYTSAVSCGVTAINMELWYAVAGSSAANTISFTSGDSTVFIAEISGQDGSDPIGVTACNHNATGTSYTIDLATTEFSHSIVFGAFKMTNVASTLTEGGSFTLAHESESGDGGSMIYQSTTSTGDYDPTWTNGTSNTKTGVAAEIKGQAAAGGSVPKMMLLGVGECGHL